MSWHFASNDPPAISTSVFRSGRRRGAVGAALFLIAISCGGNDDPTTGASTSGPTTGSPGTGGTQSGVGGAGVGGGGVGGGGSAGAGGGGIAGNVSSIDASLDDAPSVSRDAESDAKRCTPSNALFDCPEYTACDAQTMRCTTKCSSTQPCHGGCCLAGTCQTGIADGACGREGTACTNCATSPDGRRCKMYPDRDSPSRPGGYCSCDDATDCTSSVQNQCAASPKHCCAPKGAACSTAETCCSSACVFGACT